MTATNPTPESVLKKHWGYSGFRPMQAEIIGSVLKGNDTLGLMATGGGKSVTFQVPAMMLPGLTLVVTPLISLMKDQVDNLMQRGIRAYFLHSGLTRRENRLIIDKCRLGKAKILYLSPEKLQSKNFIGELRHLPVSLIVVDEAHCISQWGHDFRPSYLRIASLREMFPQAPVLALTASATPEVVADIIAQLKFRDNAATFRLSFNRSNISYVVRYCDFKEEQLIHILRSVAGCAIVYVRSRKRTRVIAEALQAAGISASFYHAGLSPEEKNHRQNLWKDDTTRVMVATTAFGMGIDKPDVRLVVHVDPPSSLEEYYQEAGRAGRDGLPSFAVSLITPASDKAALTRRLADSFPAKSYLREIYEKLCVFLGIGMGEGSQTLYEFNPLKFCMRFRLQPVPAESALKLLSQAGWIDYIAETSTRSRLMVLMNRNELYDLTLSDECERVFQFILRNYTGIFADYEHISEPLIASSLGLTERTVYENLLLLSRTHVIHYVPRQTTPYIFFPISRVPSSDLIFPRETYEHRRRQMELRIEAIKKFLFATETCRVNTLLRYFGEEPASPCHTCDVCRSQAAKNTPTPHTGASGNMPSLESRILHVAATHPQGISINLMATHIGVAPAVLLPALRELIDSRRLILQPPALILPG
ncbi:MAG: RecQ family ATP-dependent DNA helicase [Muribaculaceae bacterium]|nr:RecQ family ATP-dependent DNA helicase [Muribaculaceae bacterium]